MAKVRVHELAKELGQPSKVVLQKLQDMGEFVRSASSTIEAPVVRKLRDAFPTPPEGAAPAPAKKAAKAKKAVKKVVQKAKSKAKKAVKAVKKAAKKVAKKAKAKRK